MNLPTTLWICSPGCLQSRARPGLHLEWHTTLFCTEGWPLVSNPAAPSQIPRHDGEAASRCGCHKICPVRCKHHGTRLDLRWSHHPCRGEQQATMHVWLQCRRSIHATCPKQQLWHERLAWSSASLLAQHIPSHHDKGRILIKNLCPYALQAK